MLDFTKISAIIIESCRPEDPKSVMSYLRAGTRTSSLPAVGRTEGQLEMLFHLRYPSIPVYLVPRNPILRAFDPELAPSKGNSDTTDVQIILLLAAKGILTYRLETYTRRIKGKPTQIHRYHVPAPLSTPDSRDAYLAALYPPVMALPYISPLASPPRAERNRAMVTIGIDCGHSLAASTWILQRDGTPLASGPCTDLLSTPNPT